MSPEARTTPYDVVIVGSGFGGALIARPLVDAGARVLMLERGGWVPRGAHNALPTASVDLTEYYSMDSPYQVLAGGQTPVMGGYACVGGPSVFYGGVSFRLREADFEPKEEIVGDSGARWPYDYAELEPYYGQAEQILAVAGKAGADPTEPYRSTPYPQAPAELSAISRRVAEAGRGLGLEPFPLPLAINYGSDKSRSACTACPTCDTFACAVSAKNDLATCVLPDLLRKGLELRPKTVAVRLAVQGRRLVRVECVDKEAGRPVDYQGRTFVLAAGALGTPHLLLASGLADLNPAGDVVGRYLTRHCNGIVFGLFPTLPEARLRFHKQVGFHDFYFGHPNGEAPRGMLGSLQQLPTPPLPLVQSQAPRAARPFLGPLIDRITGLLVMAEDQPLPHNRLAVDRRYTDAFGLPRATITHRYSSRDEAARGALARQAKKILRACGAVYRYTHHIKTFSHSSGTVRAGLDPKTAPLDRWCRYRGLDNAYVVDASFMPTAGGVNPSLTIAANALRVGEQIARDAGPASGE